MANPKITVDNFQAVDFTSWIPNEVLQYSSAAAGRQAWDAQNGKHARREKGIGRIADMPQDRTPFEELLPRPALDAVPTDEPVESAMPLLDGAIKRLLKSYYASDPRAVALAYRALLENFKEERMPYVQRKFEEWSALTPSQTCDIMSKVGNRAIMEATETKVNLALSQHSPLVHQSVRDAARALALAHGHLLLGAESCYGIRQTAYAAWVDWQKLLPAETAKNIWHQEMQKTSANHVTHVQSRGVSCEAEVREYHNAVRDETRHALRGMLEKGILKDELLKLLFDLTGAKKLTDIPDRLLTRVRDAARRATAAM